jgi:hypothetical protein
VYESRFGGVTEVGIFEASSTINGERAHLQNQTTTTGANIATGIATAIATATARTTDNPIFNVPRSPLPTTDSTSNIFILLRLLLLTLLLLVLLFLLLQSSSS